MQRWKIWLPSLQRRLALAQTSWQLCLLAILGGLVAALLIILFRLAIIGIQAFFLDKSDDFSTVPADIRWMLPIAGAVLIGIIAAITGYKHYRLGIPFVISRIKIKYGLMPFRNTFNQFFGGIIALSSGFSVGREGPSVHLGAYGASTIGKYLQLPFNSIRILAGCGIAAGISASFNTPLAAVLFVMEVVLREYRVHVFIPIMLASVVGSIVTQAVFDNTSELALLDIVAISGWHLPYLVLCGVIFGVIAFVFNNNLMLLLKLFKKWPLAIRLCLAGIITAAIGYIIPLAMGAETGAIFYAINAPDDISLLLIIFIGKMLLTLFALGLGVPGGVIGPVFGLGIVLGTLLAIVPALITGDNSLAGTYALLGMAGLMAATMHAPLAALVAVMELANNPTIIVPAMLVIATAYVTAVQLFNNKSIFLLQLDFLQMPYKLSPANDVLQKVGALAVLDTNYQLLHNPDDETVMQALDNLTPPAQLLVKRGEGNETQFLLANYDVQLSMTSDSALKYLPLVGLSHQVTLAEVFSILEEPKEGAVYIYRQQDPCQLMGIIRWDQIRTLLIKQNNLL
ncbi:chloride channel protein [Rheinheimera sp. WS51]|uniref:chloride channel protein n=1 Tax=Rheinheimera sp. WS51 TaxID=3425886 RepID=UPI003D8E31A9